MILIILIPLHINSHIFSKALPESIPPPNKNQVRQFSRLGSSLSLAGTPVASTSSSAANVRTGTCEMHPGVESNEVHNPAIGLAVSIGDSFGFGDGYSGNDGFGGNMNSGRSNTGNNSNTGGRGSIVIKPGSKITLNNS